jgi:hypothetical protein
VTNDVMSINRRLFLLSSSLVVAILIGFSFGCGPPSSPNNDGAASDSTGTPELTDQVINERINRAWIRDVPEENGAADPIFWNFDESEPKEIRVVEKQIDGNGATIVLDISTTSAPGTRNPRQLSGQIRTEWKLQSGWVLRQWEIVKTENISMKYKNLPKPPAQNSNR